MTVMATPSQTPQGFEQDQAQPPANSLQPSYFEGVDSTAPAHSPAQYDPMYPRATADHQSQQYGVSPPPHTNPFTTLPMSAAIHPGPASATAPNFSTLTSASTHMGFAPRSAPPTMHRFNSTPVLHHANAFHPSGMDAADVLAGYSEVQPTSEGRSGSDDNWEEIGDETIHQELSDGSNLGTEPSQDLTQGSLVTVVGEESVKADTWPPLQTGYPQQADREFIPISSTQLPTSQIPVQQLESSLPPVSSLMAPSAPNPNSFAQFSPAPIYPSNQYHQYQTQYQYQHSQHYPQAQQWMAVPSNWQVATSNQHYPTHHLPSVYHPPPYPSMQLMHPLTQIPSMQRSSLQSPHTSIHEQDITLTTPPKGKALDPAVPIGLGISHVTYDQRTAEFEHNPAGESEMEVDLDSNFSDATLQEDDSDDEFLPGRKGKKGKKATARKTKRRHVWSKPAARLKVMTRR